VLKDIFGLVGLTETSVVEVSYVPCTGDNTTLTLP
jgi:PIG-X/PBN1 protein